MDLIRVTESQLRENDQVVTQECEACDPRSNNQVDAELRLHDGSTTQRLAVGNTAVKGHNKK